MDRFKRLLAAACAGVLTLAAMPAAVWAEEAAADSFSDDVLTYTKLGDGKVSVTACDTNVTSLHVPAQIGGFDVTAIGDEAFSNCTGLTQVELPDSIQTIGEAAFYNCTSLTEINLPEELKALPTALFCNCSKLETVEIPDSVTQIGDFAFAYCTDLTALELPEGVTSIGGYAFQYCMRLTELSIPAQVKEIGGLAFVACSKLKALRFPAATETIGDLAFVGCASLETVEVAEGNPSYVTQDNMLLTKDKSQLILYPAASPANTFTVPDHITVIGYYAFSGCSYLTSVEIPDTVKEIQEGAFSGCSSLSSIRLPQGITTIPGSMFSDCTSLTSFEIPASVTAIGDYAFFCCDKLTGMLVPDTVTAIGDKALGYTADDQGNESLLSGYTLTCSSRSKAYTYASDNGIQAVTTDFVVNWTLVSCVIGGILLIALVCIILGVRKKKQLAALEDAPAASPDPEAEAPDPDYQSILDKDPDDE